VLRDVIHLKAICPAAGVRKVADLFNQQYATRAFMAVGKKWVDQRLREHARAVLERREERRERVGHEGGERLRW
jgi:hypothetical protein